ncbi:MAG: class I SAM-dependent methyltransferase, partial [Deltaproteobacteria bacterium]|nr:class I SAM-dependent methyltransferase [Deltaproteobacteria bacterium]
MSRLSSTSELVLLWARKECYQSKKARDYLKQLDLEEGKTLYERCKEVWPYYDEVIKNRKFGVFTLIKKYCTEKINCQQLVIAGAGLDALGIEVTEHYPHVKVFELDKENMDFKSHLFAKLGNKSTANITFIEIDLLNIPSLYSNLT